MAEAPLLERAGSEGVESAIYARHLAFPPFAPARVRRAAISLERSARVLGTLQEISRATPDLDGCEQLLACVSDELQADKAVLILCNPLTRELEFVVHNQDPAIPRMYADYYADLDPTGLSSYIRGKDSRRGALPPFAVSDLSGGRGLLCPCRHGVLQRLHEERGDPPRRRRVRIAELLDPRRCMSASLAAQGPFSAEELAVLEIIAPFVSNHLERMFLASLRSALPLGDDRGVIVCDTRGRVLFCNETARELYAPRDRADSAPGISPTRVSSGTR